jgi:crotonobetainyl-CoA:carnitine CoA-transferase CaiB-like acyl-CoA transferase
VFAAPEGAALIREVADASHGSLRLVASPIRFDGEPAATPSAPPTLGQHTTEILEEG